MGYRFQFLLAIVVLAAIFHLSARYLHTISDFIIPAIRQSADALQVAKPKARQTPPVSTEKLREAKQKFELILAVNQWIPMEKPTTLPTPKAVPPALKEGPFFLQVTWESRRRPIQNPSFGPEISALLEDFVQRRRQQNTELAAITQQLFGTTAQQEAIVLLVQDEQAVAHIAQTSQTRQDFAQQLAAINEQTQQKLYEIFNRHKQNFSHPQNKISPAWKNFFKRIENYNRISKQPIETK